MLEHRTILNHLLTMQRLVRDAVVASRSNQTLSSVDRISSADTIYGIDAVIEPVIEGYLEQWGQSQPLVVIAEGLEPESGRVFPTGASKGDASIRLILDPIDGTRGLMYDKRSAWSLAGAAPNRGDATRLRDIEVSVMTELPVSKMGQADVLWAIRGSGAHGVRQSLDDRGPDQPLLLRPSTADTLAHGFASIANFFPGTKQLASKLMEDLAERLLGRADVTRAMIFDDQYICTGGQFYELIVGHDRFNADLRPEFYRLQNQQQGLCCHPYDCAAALIAEEAGVILTDQIGRPLNGPMDTLSGMSWVGYANAALRASIEPLVRDFLWREHRSQVPSSGLACGD